MQKRWSIPIPNPQLQVDLSNALNIHPITSQLLVNRGIQTVDEARNFLNANLSALHDPFLLKDMDQAVARIRRAKEKQERVLIYGDYDVDGVTSSVLLRNIFKKLGMDVLHYIPHRMAEGYGLNHSIVDYTREQKVNLLIAVDCGISAFSVVSALRQSGVDVIIFDHHEPGETLPEAVAVVDPKRADCGYPFKGLASVGLVMKLFQAIFGKIDEDLLDLVAIGTVADVAELRGENRIFVKHGLPRISKTNNHGLKALLEVARIKDKPMKPSYVGFILGPRINATGRMDSALRSLELLVSESREEALKLAQILEENNQIRQKTQNEIVQEALSLVEREINFNEHQVIVVNKPGWHKGVLGIVASRIMEKYYRPAIVISTENGVGTGSARSIEGFHLYEALTYCSSHLENYGGHRRAAGLTVKEEKIQHLRELINDFAKKSLSFESFIPTLTVDAQVPLNLLDMNLMKTIEQLEPHGEGNPAPVLCTRQVTVKSPPQVLGKDTLKFGVTDGEVILSAVGFGMGKMRDMIAMGRKIDIAYQLEVDDWNKEPTVSLKLKDIKEAGDRV